MHEVARARTFGFMQDVEAMRAAGLALGGLPAGGRDAIFLEPEGLDTDEIYCNGISTSLPADVQEQVKASGSSLPPRT